MEEESGKKMFFGWRYHHHCHCHLDNRRNLANVRSLLLPLQYIFQNNFQLNLNFYIKDTMPSLGRMEGEVLDKTSETSEEVSYNLLPTHSEKTMNSMKVLHAFLFLLHSRGFLHLVFCCVKHFSYRVSP